MNTLADVETTLFAKRSIVGFIEMLRNGDSSAWITVAVIVATVAGISIYNKVTGSDVGSKDRRREGSKRGKIVLFEHKRSRR